MQHHNRGRSLKVAVSALSVLAMNAPALAKDASDEAENTYFAQLRQCQSETADTARLACFDKTAAAILAASDKGELRIVDKQEVRETKRKLFGFSLPDFGIFGGKKDRDGRPVDTDEVNQIDTTITKVSRGPGGSYFLTTAEGAVWDVYDVPSRLMTPRVGDKLDIRKGAFSAYFLRIGGQPAVKGRRVN